MPLSSGKKQSVSIKYWNPSNKLHGIASYTTVILTENEVSEIMSHYLEEFDVSVIAKLLPLKGPGWSVKEIKCNNTQTPQFINNQSQTSAWTYYIRGSYRKS